MEQKLKSKTWSNGSLPMSGKQKLKVPNNEFLVCHTVKDKGRVTAVSKGNLAKCV